MADFRDVAAVLRTWPGDVPEPSAFEHASHRRLVRALEGFRDDSASLGSGDLAGLVRQILRFESLKRERVVEIEVPAFGGWPSVEEWESFGVIVTLQLSKTYRIAASPWSPSWAEGLTDSLAVMGPPRAPPRSNLPADPSIEQDLQIGTFRSPGQAAALRAMSLLPPNQTLVVGLSTGSGKSLVFQGAAIRAGRKGDLTVVVVPTTALAIDQETRMQTLLSQISREQAALPVAYHSGLSAEDKRAFRRRLESGEQSVVITSPEAVVGALRVALQRVAKQGRLAWLAIDEAHMVSQWGDTFRPDFQFVAASVASWRRLAPEGKALRTLLLSATLTDDCLDTLRTLFAPGTQIQDRATPSQPGDGFHVLVAPDLRSEPDYWVTAAPDESTRRRYIADALRHLPRPIIVYTAKPGDATTLAASLRDDLRLKRVALFRGGDAATERGTDDLTRWTRGDIDIVVATSAFGLGMDHSDVRAVVHACIPETVDRFYQEVGRGGRDGRASLSLWVHQPGDRAVAARLARSREIGLARGWERWEVMRIHASRVPGTDDAWSVSLDDKPPDLFEDSDANRAWNVRTLVLMARAGLLSLGTPTLDFPAPKDLESDADYEMRCHAILSAGFGRAVVIVPKAIPQSAWDRAIATLRSGALARDSKDQRRLYDLVDMRRPFNDIFSDAYTLTLDERQIVPISYPGQCPLTRERVAHAGQHRVPVDFAFTRGLLAELANAVILPGLYDAPQTWITYAPPAPGTAATRQWSERINKLLRHLVHGGISEVALPTSRVADIDRKRLLQSAAHGYVVLRGLHETDPRGIDGLPTELPLPRVTLLPPDATSRDVERLLDLRRPVHVVILPDTVTDPDRPDRRFVATRRHDRLEPLLERWAL